MVNTGKIAVVLICLNDEKCIGTMLQSIKQSQFNELIVIDGGSDDASVKIAKKFTDTVYISERGMLTQTIFGINLSKSDLIFLAEADHVYPPNFLQNLSSEFIASKYDGMQATLEYRNKRNFFERGHGEFYKIHLRNKGERSIIACPQIWERQKLISLLELTSNAQGFSFDTQRAESASKLGYVVGIGETVAYENQAINFKKFLERHANYGRGDNDFYRANSLSWTPLRKLKSITHIFRRYGVSYPIQSIKYGNPFIGVPYFWLIMIYRYYAWLATALKK